MENILGISVHDENYKTSFVNETILQNFTSIILIAHFCKRIIFVLEKYWQLT